MLNIELAKNRDDIRNYGWRGSIKDFQNTSSIEVLECLKEFHGQHYESESIQRLQPQITAWEDCIEFLKESLSDYSHHNDSIIFEYVIPRSGLCRPDVIIIQPRGDITVKVIEFKKHPRLELHEKCQIKDYVSKIANYHDFCHRYVRNIQGFLVSTHPECKDSNFFDYDHNIHILGRKYFSQVINSTSSFSKVTPVKELPVHHQEISEDETVLKEFISSLYKPSPAIVHTARGIYKNRKVPRVSTVESSNFYDVLEQVQDLIKQAQENQSHHLIMIHGEPGSGKTFLGLEIAHKDYSNSQSPGEAIFLSGNRPLVDVLSSLTSDTFVQLLSNFKKEYKYQEYKEAKTPIENIVIFDEAQRAWDSEKMQSKFSEPDIILEIATRPSHNWSVTIALIGHGQEIKGGEEAGVILWAQAVKKVLDYRDIHLFVHGADIDIDNFKVLDLSKIILDTDSKLYLNSSLRSHDATQYHQFINSFLLADLESAKTSFASIKDKYVFRWTDDINKAKRFLDGYADNIHYKDGRFQYGALRSSTAKNSSFFKDLKYNQKVAGVMNYVLYHAFRELNSNSGHFNKYESYYSNRLIYAANEYQCQGLELDMALVEWGDDLIYLNELWQCPNNTKKHKDKFTNDAAKLIINSYRVLLTRGRDATIVFTKNESLQRLFKLCDVEAL